MFRRSRLMILTFAYVFLLAGALGAYARCFDGPRSFSERSENGSWHIEESYLDAELLHCPEDLNVYASGKSNKQYSPTMLSKVADQRFTYRIAGVASLLLSPHQRVPLYQLEVVYRI